MAVPSSSSCAGCAHPAKERRAGNMPLAERIGNCLSLSLSISFPEGFIFEGGRFLFVRALSLCRVYGGGRERGEEERPVQVAVTLW